MKDREHLFWLVDSGGSTTHIRQYVARREAGCRRDSWDTALSDEKYYPGPTTVQVQSTRIISLCTKAVARIGEFKSGGTVVHFSNNHLYRPCEQPTYSIVSKGLTKLEVLKEVNDRLLDTLDSLERLLQV